MAYEIFDVAQNTLSSIAGGNTYASLRHASLLLGTGVTSAALNDLARAIKDISSQVIIGGVPIETENIKMVHSVDIPTTMVIDESSKNKKFISDNTAPRPRVWTVNGYITSLAPTIESFMLIKPTLLLQRKILEYAINKRDKVKVKLNTGEIIDTYIQQLSFEDDAKMMNASRVSCTVMEASTLTTCVLSKLADLTSSETKSLPSSIFSNLGTISAEQGAIIAVGSVLSII